MKQCAGAGKGDSDKMRVESIEIYSNETNASFIQHPGRKFPGFLFQGDTLYSLCVKADEGLKGWC